MKLQYLKNVASLKLNHEKCNGCGMCLKVCPHRIFRIENGKSHINDLDDCMECGACLKNCPEGAIKVNSGVGCAAGIINGIIRGTEPTC